MYESTATPLTRFQYNNKGMSLSINSSYDLQNTPQVVYGYYSNQVVVPSIRWGCP